MSNAKFVLLTGDMSCVVTEQSGFTCFRDGSCVISYINIRGLLVSFEYKIGNSNADSNMYTTGFTATYSTCDGLYKLHSEDENVITILCGKLLVD